MKIKECALFPKNYIEFVIKNHNFFEPTCIFFLISYLTQQPTTHTNNQQCPSTYYQLVSECNRMENEISLDNSNIMFEAPTLQKFLFFFIEIMLLRAQTSDPAPPNQNQTQIAAEEKAHHELDKPLSLAACPEYHFPIQK